MTIEINSALQIIVSIVTIIGVFVGIPLWTYKMGLKKGENDFKRLARENRYKLIYAPLRKILSTKHITTATFTKYAYFSQRWKRAKPEIKKFKLKSALKKILDKGKDRTIAEVEFGGSFPLDEIRSVVDNNTEWADNKLISLIQNAERAKYEAQSRNWKREPNYDLMDFEELELSNHIYDVFFKLNKKNIR